MWDTEDVVHAWNRAGNPTPHHLLGLYAQALTTERPVGAYHTLREDQEDRAILALYRVDRPHATFADLYQAPPLALSSYHQLLHDLAREGLGPLESHSGPAVGGLR
ncbi:hypothetical protein [Sinomonas humi]|uniref:Uncharacterized protein n=1 Tax=Sinomonas humi TaxID=1338436 RepID=A0A0B2ARL1_9MICC|nr:hypothetical protein [Sinomonas humi]KHL04567.1 hypothetical protein LK10_04600 [Sinomonas humi]